MANKITTLYEDESKTNALFPRTKRLAISDENNNPLTEVGFYTADTITSGVESIIPGGITADLLWTNSAPTSSFAAQTISIANLSDYKYLIIIVNATTSTTTYQSQIITTYIRHRIIFTGSTLTYRDVEFVAGGLSFLAGKNQSTYGGSTTENNTLVIPIYIYGIKSANAVSGQTKMEAIWTNPSPTSSFSSTTITPTNFSNYARGTVLFGYDTSNSPQCLVNFTKGGTFICNMFNSNSSRVFRTFTVSDSTITFGGGSSAGGNNNGAAIPLVVYGIR